MSYVDDNLMPNEKILLKSKITFAIFISPVMVFCIALLILTYSINQESNTKHHNRRYENRKGNF
jgi:hypothetical protein